MGAAVTGKDIKQVTCGCCSNGCCCLIHEDRPRGLRNGPCAYHAALPFAPLDQTFRYDASIGQYVRVPVRSEY